MASKARLFAMAMVAGLLTGCAASPSFLQAAGPVAAEQRHLFWLVIAALMVVVLPVFIGLPLVLWRYRRGNDKARYDPKWDWNPRLEFVIWGVPVLIVVLLGIQLWHSTQTLDPYKRLDGNGTITVQAVGLDWKWLFIYPDQHIATVNRLVIPAGRPVHIDLTSDTVMQSLFIPRLGGQIYAMAGMRTQLNLKADRPGSYFGENTQYNGEGFHKQNFRTLAVTDAAFDGWVKRVKASGSPLNEARYRTLAKKSVPDAPMEFSAVPEGLFARIIAKYMQPERRGKEGGQ
ncbi:COX aromatic rich motif-containing protein [Stakelama sp. CBK3Z-3]|uniref:Ubiquinol oxidase subunit 2 n=1 Tax=Stakelama flava TaxID=2860338 RepID=A0ABS6XP69_9SPHN|nr:COX aromatic rich motif-containing protein [Stakelama flava]MBW4332009.1 COX aromatic rich motif-containing protein [Stakelama flava]